MIPGKGITLTIEGHATAKGSKNTRRPGKTDYYTMINTAGKYIYIQYRLK